MNVEKLQPYSERPPSSRAMVGIAVPTPSAWNATIVTHSSAPIDSAR
jgi:hypothetical protein